jgi:anti-sigma factor RsiW
MESSCRYSAYIDSYAHGELPTDARSEFEQHISTCAACRNELKEMTSLSNTLNDSFAVSLDERFNYRVVSALRDEKSETPVREFRVALEDIVISLATLLVIILIGLQLFNKPRVNPVEMAGRLTKIEKSSLEQSNLSNDQVLELVVRSK